MVSQSFSSNHLIHSWDHFAIHRSFLYIFLQVEADSVHFKGQSSIIPRPGSLTKYGFCQEGPWCRGSWSRQHVAASSQYPQTAPDRQTAGCWGALIGMEDHWLAANQLRADTATVSRCYACLKRSYNRLLRRIKKFYTLGEEIWLSDRPFISEGNTPVVPHQIFCLSRVLEFSRIMNLPMNLEIIIIRWYSIFCPSRRKANFSHPNLHHYMLHRILSDSCWMLKVGSTSLGHSKFVRLSVWQQVSVVVF